jgi:Acyl CoA:acetate/3-ketoacid CoA transferase, beta subunit
VTYTADEMMAVEASRRLTNDTVCFVGIGLPSLAANLARRTHAPGCVLVYESGTIGAKPTRLPLSIGDGELAETPTRSFGAGDVRVLAPERPDRSGLPRRGADRPARQPQQHGDRRLRDADGAPAGGGGAPEIATSVREVFVMLRHSRRAFVEQLDFATSRGERVRYVVTDLGVLEPLAGSSRSPASIPEQRWSKCATQPGGTLPSRPTSGRRSRLRGSSSPRSGS